MEMEVIYISSDESDSQKENKKKSTPEKVEENNFKKKISQISDIKRSPSYHSTPKRRKLNKSQNTPEADTDNFAMSDCILLSNKEQESTVEMPKLVVKERKVISYVAHDIFPQFISLCLKKCHDSDMEKIIDKLKRRYEELDSIYAGSENFALFLNEKRDAIIKNDKKLYVHIGEVMNELKRIIREQKNSKEKRTNSVAYDAVPSTSYAVNKTSVKNTAESGDEDDDTEYIDNDTLKKIKTIQIAMRKCEVRIKKFEEAEVDFDDDGDSNYIKMERYKQRMVELYNKMCELTGENTDAGRSYLRPKHISTTQIVAVDQAITNFINAKISKRNKLKKMGSLTDNLICPDFWDILECISRCNEKRNLGLDDAKQRQIAKKSFPELIRYLQRARQNDYWDTFSLHLENSEEDPAIKDKELAEKLERNRTKGEKRLAAVFEKYKKKQDELKEQVVDSRTTTEDESDTSDDDTKLNEDKDISGDTLSVSSSSNENDDSEKEVEEIIESDVLPVERNKNSAVNIDRDTNKTVSITTEKNVPQEKCDKKAEIKTTKENDVTVSNKSENKTAINEETPINRSPISKIVVTSGNLTGTVTQKTPKDSLSTFTTNCADTAGRIEEYIAETVIEDVSETITDSAAKTADGTAVLTNNVAEVITEDVEEAIVADVVARKTVTEELTEVDPSSDNLLDEAKKQPLLRVRSFAKPPTTWDDSRQAKTIQENIPKITNQNKDVIDLTDESNVNEPAPATPTASLITKRAIHIGNTVVPLRSKHQTFVLPSGSNYICVQNTTNNYLKVDMRTGEIIAPVRDSETSTITQMPTSTQAATVRQVQLQNAGVTAKTAETSAKRNDTILKIVPKKTFIMKTSDAQAVPKTQVHIAPNSQMHLAPKTQVHITPQQVHIASKTQQMHITPKTQQVNISSKKPQVHIAPRTQMSVAPKMQVHVSSKTQVPVAPKTQMHVSSKTQMPVALKTQVHVSSKTQIPVIPTTQGRVVPKSQVHVSPKTQMSVAPKTQVHVSSKTQVPVAPKKTQVHVNPLTKPK